MHGCVQIAVAHDPVNVRHHHADTSLRSRLAELVELSGLERVMRRRLIGHAVEEEIILEARDEHTVHIVIERMPRLLEVDRKITRDGSELAALAAGADHRADGHGELTVLILGIHGDGVGAAVDGDAVDIARAARLILREHILIRLDRGGHLIGIFRLGVLGDRELTFRRKITRGRGDSRLADSERVGVSGGVYANDIGIGGGELDLLHVDGRGHAQDTDVAGLDVHDGHLIGAHLGIESAVILRLFVDVRKAQDDQHRQRDDRDDADADQYLRERIAPLLVITVFATVSHHFYRFHIPIIHDNPRFIKLQFIQSIKFTAKD